jgi:hypothetical protein
MAQFTVADVNAWPLEEFRKVRPAGFAPGDKRHSAPEQTLDGCAFRAQESRAFIGIVVEPSGEEPRRREAGDRRRRGANGELNRPWHPPMREPAIN